MGQKGGVFVKTAICYYSRHHGNTLKVLEAMAEGRDDVELVDVTSRMAFYPEHYDVIAFASGIYYGKFHQSVMDFARQYFPNRGKTFFVFTGGSPSAKNTAAIRAALVDKNAQGLGQFYCKGYDTYGPFKLVGGIAKGRPNGADLQAARDFFDALVVD